MIVAKSLIRQGRDDEATAFLGEHGIDRSEFDEEEAD